MRSPSRRLRRKFALVLLIAPMALAAAPKPATPPVVHIAVDATSVAIDFELSGKDAVGFMRRQHSAAEQEAVDRVMHTLSSTSEWIRFNPQAQCLFSSSSVGANMYRTIDSDAPPSKLPITKPAFEAHYVFQCRAIAALRSIDLAFIAQFPRVHEVDVDVITPTGHRDEKITSPNASISLTPN